MTEYDNWLDKIDHDQAEADYKSEQIEMHSINKAEEMAEWPLCESGKAAVLDRIAGLEWNDAQSKQFETLLTRIAFGQPIGPSDCSLLLSREHVVHALARDLIKEK